MISWAIMYSAIILLCISDGHPVLIWSLEIIPTFPHSWISELPCIFFFLTCYSTVVTLHTIVFFSVGTLRLLCPRLELVVMDSLPQWLVYKAAYSPTDVSLVRCFRHNNVPFLFFIFIWFDYFLKVIFYFCVQTFQTSFFFFFLMFGNDQGKTYQGDFLMEKE